LLQRVVIRCNTLCCVAQAVAALTAETRKQRRDHAAARELGFVGRQQRQAPQARDGILSQRHCTVYPEYAKAYGKRNTPQATALETSATTSMTLSYDRMRMVHGAGADGGSPGQLRPISDSA
jgi:hypothetical protein